MFGKKNGPKRDVRNEDVQCIYGPPWMLAGMTEEEWIKMNDPQPESLEKCDDPALRKTGMDETWKCGCGMNNTANFCTECGAPKPDGSADAAPAPIRLSAMLSGGCHTDSGRPDYRRMEMGESLGMWRCRCGMMNSDDTCSVCGSPKCWRCLKCGEYNTANFCTECGASKPWLCTSCRTFNAGALCGNCGIARYTKGE